MTMRVEWHQYISIDPDVCHGKPCFKGTRIMVATILELMEAGESYQDIKAGYPSLTPRHVQAALQFAREAVESGRVAVFQSARHAVSH